MSLLGIIFERTGPAAVPPPPAADPGAPTATGGTPVTAPATRHGFTASESRAEAGHRTWRMADVVAAIGGGPRARMLIEAASRPGPVEPGSLLEAVKALRPAPSLPESRLV